MKANRTNGPSWIATSWLLSVAIFLTVALIISQGIPAFADDQQEATQLVEKARLTLDSFMSDNNMGALRDLLKSAEGVLIVPQLLKGAFIVGAAGGTVFSWCGIRRPDNGVSPLSIPLVKRASVSRSAARLRR